MQLLTQIVLVALGGALGSLTRWGVGVAFFKLFGADFPWGTFFINISGCLFLGWFTSVFKEMVAPVVEVPPHLRNLTLFVATGFTGAYTTFSTYEVESFERLEVPEKRIIGLAYLIASMVLGLIAVQVGVWLGRTK